jgi:hypothetical protein
LKTDKGEGSTRKAARPEKGRTFPWQEKPLAMRRRFWENPIVEIQIFPLT